MKYNEDQILQEIVPTFKAPINNIIVPQKWYADVQDMLVTS